MLPGADRQACPVREANTLGNARNAHVGPRDDGGRDVTNEPTNEKRPRRAASWAIGGVAGYALAANLPRSVFTNRLSAPLVLISRKIAL
jgi:hypothetical protein